MLYSIGLFVALVGSSVAVAPPFADAFGLIKVAVALAGALIVWLSFLGYELRGTPIDRPIAAAVGAYLIAAVLAVDPRLAITGVYSQPFYGLMAIFPALLIFYGAATHTMIPAPLVCAALVAIVQGAACAAQLAGLAPAPFDFQGGRAIGAIGSPVFLGATLAPCIPAAVGLMGRDGWLRWLGAAGTAAGFLALTACASRGPWLGALAGLWAFAVASGRLRPRRAHLGALAAILGVLAALSGAMGKGLSDSGRLAVWKIAVLAGIDKPITGWGPDGFALAIRALKSPALVAAGGDSLIQASAHNDLLQAWATTGALGLAAYVWLWVAVLGVAWNGSKFARVIQSAWRGTEGFRPNQDYPAAFGALVALFVVLKFNPVPPTALYIGAAISGWTMIGSPGRFSIIGWTGGVVGFMLAALFCAVMLTTEALDSFGVIALKAGDLRIGADLIRQANELDPGSITHAANRVQVIMRVAPNVGAGRRREFVKRAIRAASGAVKAHPQDPAAYELMANVELWSSQFIGPKEPKNNGLARASLRTARRAMELDPLYAYTATILGRGAILVGDREAWKAASDAFDRAMGARLRARSFFLRGA